MRSKTASVPFIPPWPAANKPSDAAEMHGQGGSVSGDMLYCRQPNMLTYSEVLDEQKGGKTSGGAQGIKFCQADK